MAIKNILARGVGFAAGSVKWIVTAGFSIGAAVITAVCFCAVRTSLPDSTVQRLSPIKDSTVQFAATIGDCALSTTIGDCALSTEIC